MEASTIINYHQLSSTIINYHQLYPIIIYIRLHLTKSPRKSHGNPPIVLWKPHPPWCKLHLGLAVGPEWPPRKPTLRRPGRHWRLVWVKLGKIPRKKLGNPWKNSDFTRKIWEEMVISLGKLGRSGDFVGIDWEMGISAMNDGLGRNVIIIKVTTTNYKALSGIYSPTSTKNSGP